MMSLIYHYTSSQGLLGILQQSYLRLTHVKFLNDSRELYHGMDIITESLKNELEKLKKLEEIPFLKNNPLFALAVETDKITSLVYPQNIKQADDALEHLLDHFHYYSEISPFYTTSFCLLGDKLRQWAAYCPKGGYSIGFDKSIMDNSNIVINQNSTKANITIKTIDYDNTSSLDNILKDFIVEIENLTSIYHLINDKEKFKEAFSDWFIKLRGSTYNYSLLALQHKDKNFEDEEEVRATLSFENSKDSASTPEFETEFFTKGCLAIPFKKLVFKGEAIKEIVVGPMHHQELACISLMELRKCLGLNFKIIKSNIPLRSFQ